MAQVSENAITWGERELDKGVDGRSREFQQSARRYLRRFAGWLLAAAILILLLVRCVHFVGPGNGAVRWKRFFGGTVHQPSLSEGFHLTWPWDELIQFDLRVREFKLDYGALANDGLPVTATVSLNYRVNPARLSRVYQDYGPGYEGVLIAPKIGSIVREIVSRYPADELYAYARARVEQEIRESAVDELDYKPVINTQRDKSDARDGYVFVEGIMVLDIKLPATVTSAIESKMAQDQAAQEYEFKVKREQMESQRRALEVEGIRNYASVAQAPWFRDYLRYIEIQANYDMAKSPNAKLIFLGNSGAAPKLDLAIGPP